MVNSRRSAMRASIGRGAFVFIPAKGVPIAEEGAHLA